MTLIQTIYVSRDEVLNQMLDEIMGQPKEKDNQEDTHARKWITQQLIMQFSLDRPQLKRQHAEETLQHFKFWRKRLADIEARIQANQTSQHS